VAVDGGALVSTSSWGLSAPSIVNGYGFGAGIASAALTGAAIVTLLVVFGTRDPAVRRRILVLVAVVAVTALVVNFGFGQFLDERAGLDPPGLLDSLQWTEMVLVPVPVFALGALVVYRYEHWLRLVTDGRRSAGAGVGGTPVSSGT
jgi:hypothetical protein